MYRITRQVPVLFINFILQMLICFGGAPKMGIFCKPVVSKDYNVTGLPPFVQFSFPIEFMDSAEYAEFMKGINDPVFNATTQSGWFTGMRYKWNVTIGTDSPSKEYDDPDPTSKEPIMRVTVLLPPRAKIHAYMRGHAHLIDDDFAYEELYNYTNYGMTPF
ncbi:uncharacterized protein LOC135831753 [Planococcus citri]|uniref:uncharacterized protein LOC135831753 n=1 Tax=Planococcus citri TaxID=170843 RepID=UPI0031F75D0D